jgi:hypothetical protein
MNTNLTRMSYTFAAMAGISFVCGLLILSSEGRL